MSIFTFADNRAKEFFYKQGFKLQTQSQKLKMLDKIEIYKRATLVKYTPSEARVIDACSSLSSSSEKVA